MFKVCTHLSVSFLAYTLTTFSVNQQAIVPDGGTFGSVSVCVSLRMCIFTHLFIFLYMGWRKIPEKYSGKKLIQWCQRITTHFLKILFIYFQREGKGVRKRGKEIWAGCLLQAPNWGPGQQPKYVPWRGITFFVELFYPLNKFILIWLFTYYK